MSDFGALETVLANVPAQVQLLIEVTPNGWEVECSDKHGELFFFVADSAWTLDTVLQKINLRAEEVLRERI